MLRALLLVLAFLTAAPATAQTTPPQGSPLRAELLNTLRPTVMAEIGGPIDFVVTELRVMGPWPTPTYAHSGRAARLSTGIAPDSARTWHRA